MILGKFAHSIKLLRTLKLLVVLLLINLLLFFLFLNAVPTDLVAKIGNLGQAEINTLSRTYFSSAEKLLDQAAKSKQFTNSEIAEIRDQFIDELRSGSMTNSDIAGILNSPSHSAAEKAAAADLNAYLSGGVSEGGSASIYDMELEAKAVGLAVEDFIILTRADARPPQKTLADLVEGNPTNPNKPSGSALSHFLGENAGTDNYVSWYNGDIVHDFNLSAPNKGVYSYDSISGRSLGSSGDITVVRNFIYMQSNAKGLDLVKYADRVGYRNNSNEVITTGRDAIENLFVKVVDKTYDYSTMSGKPVKITINEGLSDDWIPITEFLSARSGGTSVASKITESSLKQSMLGHEIRNSEKILKGVTRSSEELSNIKSANWQNNVESFKDANSFGITSISVNDAAKDLALPLLGDAAAVANGYAIGANAHIAVRALALGGGPVSAGVMTVTAGFAIGTGIRVLCETCKNLGDAAGAKIGDFIGSLLVPEINRARDPKDSGPGKNIYDYPFKTADGTKVIPLGSLAAAASKTTGESNSAKAEVAGLQAEIFATKTNINQRLSNQNVSKKYGDTTDKMIDDLAAKISDLNNKQNAAGIKNGGNAITNITQLKNNAKDAKNKADQSASTAAANDFQAAVEAVVQATVEAQEAGVATAQAQADKARFESQQSLAKANQAAKVEYDAEVEDACINAFTQVGENRQQGEQRYAGFGGTPAAVAPLLNMMAGMAYFSGIGQFWQNSVKAAADKYNAAIGNNITNSNAALSTAITNIASSAGQNVVVNSLGQVMTSTDISGGGVGNLGSSANANEPQFNYPTSSGGATNVIDSMSYYDNGSLVTTPIELIGESHHRLELSAPGLGEL
jgi:hypothetical protein